MDSKKRKTNKVLFGSHEVHDSVATPADLYYFLDEIYKFDFDPCPYNEDWSPESVEAGECWDGREIEWGQSNYVNPPYSHNKYNKIEQWVAKAVEEMKKGKLSVLLLPGRGDTNYFQSLVWPNVTGIRHLNYMVFDGYTGKSPIPILVLEFDPDKEPIFQFEKMLGQHRSYKI